MPGDEVGLADLFGRVFHKSVTPDWWLWKYKGLRGPTENVWLAATDAENRPVGQNAGIPAYVKLHGEVRPVILSVDIMTSPDWRRRGILTGLCEVAFPSWASAGVACVLGLPNEQWGSRAELFGWRHLFPLAWLKYPMHIEEILLHTGRIPNQLHRASYALAVPLSYARHLRWKQLMRQFVGREPVTVMDIRSDNADLAFFDRLWSRLSPRFDNVLVRSGEWVKWRYLEGATFPYRVLLAMSESEPLGYIAYRLDEPPARAVAYLADLFTAPDDFGTAATLLMAAFDDLWQRKTETVRTTAVPCSFLHTFLRAARFRVAKGAFDAALVPLDQNLDVAELSNPRSWYMAGGDFDIV